MRCSLRNARYGAAGMAIGLSAALATSALALEPQAPVVFDTLGPAACEMPPPHFDVSAFKTYAETTPDAPIARGKLGGSLTDAFAGGGLYGADEAGGFVVGVQGMLLGDDPALTVLCLVLVRLGEADAFAGAIVGEDRLDGAADGAFLGVFKLVRRNADGMPETLATGSVEGGAASFGMVDGILVDGTVTIEGTITLAADGEVRPITASIAIPRAENVLRPALRLTRD